MSEKPASNQALEQLRTLFAVAIVKTIDRNKLSVHHAEKHTGVPYP